MIPCSPESSKDCGDLMSILLLNITFKFSEGAERIGGVAISWKSTRGRFMLVGRWVDKRLGKKKGGKG